MAYRIYKKGQHLFHWKIIGVFAAFVFIFGLVCNFLAFPALTVGDYFDNLLRTIQLFLPERMLLIVPEGAWYLSIAKFLGGVTFLFVIIQVFFQFALDQYQVWRLQGKKNHVIITGFGQCGQQFALAVLARGKEVLAIDLEPNEQQQNFVSQHKHLTLLSGEANDRATLAKTAIHNAECVIFASPDNLVNIQGVMHLRQLLKENPSTKQKTAYIHINDPDLVESLKDYPHFLTEDNTLKVISFNKHRIAARRLLLSYPFYQYADLRGQDRVRIVIFGFGIQGQQLALQFAKNSHYRDFKAPHIIVVDPKATQLGQEFLSRYPALHDPQVCTLTLIDFDIHANALDVPNENVRSAFNFQEKIHFLQALEMQGNGAYGQSLTALLLCFEDDYQNVTGALRLRLKSQQSRWALAPIFVKMTQDLQALSVPVDKTPYFDEVVQHFGQVEQICTWQEIIEGSSDDLAHFLHNAYNARYGTGTPWSKLSETLRDANRGAADHLGVKLASVGYWVSGDPSHWSRSVDLTVDSNTKERMAILEHRRWNVERLLNGWQYGTRRDDNRKIHPCIVPFDKLPESEKEKDRTHIQDLQYYFSSEIPKNVINTALSTLRQQYLGKKKGAKVLPAVSIGLIVDQPHLKTKLFELVSRLFKDYKNYHITFMTSLKTSLDVEFAKKAPDSLLIPRAYPYDLQRDEENVNKALIKSQLEISQKANWVIDLMPAGKKVIGLSLKERILLHQRAETYQIERADIIIFVGENAKRCLGTAKNLQKGWLITDEKISSLN